MFCTENLISCSLSLGKMEFETLVFLFFFVYGIETEAEVHNN